MKTNKYLLPLIIILFSNALIAQTGFVNNGMKINIYSGAYIYVVDFANNQTGGIDGIIDIDGNLTVNGDMANNSDGNIFTNTEAVPDGNIILGGSDQTIYGTTPIFFENLHIINATKTLSINNCEVKGIFDVDGVLDLNQNRLILDNGNPVAISYHSGFVKSETTPQDGLGEIEWKIGSTIGTYAVPFGSGAGGNDLNLILATQTSANPVTGSVVFATYPADMNNLPYPSGISSLDTLTEENLADRYWKIEPSYTTNPDITLSFNYTHDDIDNTDNPQMIEANLEAIRFNDVQNTWLDMNMTGTCDVQNKTVSTQVISGTNFFTWWTLYEFELRISNAFTPNGDGVNDVFLKGYDVEIINRWGQLLYKGKEGWDGAYNGKLVSPGAYFYIATIPDFDNKTKTITGSITFVSK
ncbi:MAG: gliding motility-associated C-terminal domain-containing protein [Bacteroidota bacterium]